jgi:thioredoxin 1
MKDFAAQISEGTVLVDFYADWCGPCAAISGFLEEIAAENDLKLVKVNVDENHSLANDYNISSIPTLIVFRNGQVDQTVIGAYPKETLVKRLGL